MQVHVINAQLHIEARDQISRADLLRDLRKQLGAIQEQRPYRHSAGAGWWTNSGSSVAALNYENVGEQLAAERELAAEDALRADAKGAGATVVNYPNREHGNADRAAKRRALTALNSIIEEAQMVIRSLETETAADPSAARRIADGSISVAINLAALESLRDVREWHAADLADAAEAANA